MNTLTNFWYRSAYRRAIVQGAAVLIVVFIGLGLIGQLSNLENVQAPKFTSSPPFLTFEFLNARAGIALSHGLIFDIDSNDSRMDAILNGAWNTIRLASVLIGFASIMGLLVGIGRLSDFYLIRKACTLYVEILRNIPALLQIYIWYVVIWLTAPAISDAIAIDINFFGLEILQDFIFISNKGFAIPWLIGQDNLSTWLFVAGIAGIGAVLLRRYLQKRQDALGGNQRTNRYPIFMFLAISVIAYILLDSPFTGQTPGIIESGAGGAIQNYKGGMVIT